MFLLLAKTFCIEFCRTDESNNFVRKMFVASDGIRILVSMLQRDYEQNKEIMVSVLETPSMSSIIKMISLACLVS